MKAVWIDEHLHKQLKQKAERENRTIYGVVDDLINLGVEREKNLTKNVSTRLQTITNTKHRGEQNAANSPEV